MPPRNIVHIAPDARRLNRYLWLCIGFLVIYVPIASAVGQVRAPSAAVWMVLGFGAVNAAGRTLSAARNGGFNPPLQGWVFTILDVILIAVGVWMTGGVHSDLWLLFLVVLISEVVFSPARHAVVLSSFVVLAYTLSLAPDLTSPNAVLTAATRAFFLTLVAMFARRLSVDRAARAEEAALLREELSATAERARIAQEVHDGLGHAMVGTLLRLEVAARTLQGNPSEAEEILKQEIPALREAWNSARDLAFHLKPWSPDPDGLAEGVRRCAAAFSARTGLHVKTEISEFKSQPTAVKQQVVMRVLQEALTNTARHADATEVCVSLGVDGALILTVADNGVGFESSVEGMGLSGMRDAAARVQGSLSVIKGPVNGTTLTLTIPLED
jgi:signal transduction histidine kinase